MQAHAGIGKVRPGQAWPDKARQGQARPRQCRPGEMES